ncbi:MAG: hypothetical protein IJX16_04705 [Clostridia bacterium]|nr:hypothetical protein [Clostridia bacterium]
MNEIRNNQPNNEGEKSKAKIFWMHVGFVAMALVLAVVTVFVLNLNR